MKRVMVQYKVKADKAGENAEYVRKVFAELKQNGPAALCHFCAGGRCQLCAYRLH